MVRQQIIGRECDKIVAQGMDLACNQTISFINTMTCSSLKEKKKRKQEYHHGGSKRNSFFAFMIQFNHQYSCYTYSNYHTTELIV